MAMVGAAILAAQTSAQQRLNIGVAPVGLTESSYVFDTAEQHRIRAVVVVRGLDHPFAVALLPDGDALISERNGKLRRVRNVDGTHGAAATLEAVAVKGVPVLEPPYNARSLLDVVLHPQFAQNGLVYFTFNKLGRAGDPEANPPTRQGRVLTVYRGKLSGDELTGVREIFAGGSGYNGGSRLAFGKDGLLYVATGAPYGSSAPQLDNIYGKVLRIKDDGRVPDDNPFVGVKGARPEIFTVGHRDQLGLAVHPMSGAVLAAEHGPNGGDEINWIVPGKNYGWPGHTFGRTYEGPRFASPPIAEGIEPPLILWVPSIGPSGLVVYTGDRFPAWKGNLFVGSARWGEIPRTGSLQRVVLTDQLDEIRREALLADLHQRIRDVRQGPDGLLYVLTDEDDGALLRIEPAS